MKECLVTKLKESVEDDSLLKLGEFIITKKSDITPNLTTTRVRTRSAIPGMDLYVEVKSGNGFYTDNTLSATTKEPKTLVPGAPEYYVSPGTIIGVRPKSYVAYFEADYCIIDLSQLKYLTNLRVLDFVYCDLIGSLKDLATGIGSAFTEIYIERANAALNINDLRDVKSLTKCKFTYNDNIVGTVAEAFGSNTNIESFDFAFTKVSGSLENFVAAQIAAGRTSATVAFPWAAAAANVTYKGIPLSSNPDLPVAGNNNAFSWTSNGTITWS